MIIEQNIVDDIINRSDIVVIVGKLLTLKKSGVNYFACCPFHKEKTASLSINTHKQFFYCFGCHESGNVITFLMRYHGYDFITTVKQLASDCGVTIPNNTKQSIEDFDKEKIHKISLHAIMNKATSYYLDNLQNSKLAINYLNHRHLSAAIIDKFSIGYAINNFNSLKTVFNDNNANMQLLLDCGLIVQNNDNKTQFFDRFRHRIMFPIRDIKGQVIAFGGRSIDEDIKPKYLNSPETTIFNKSIELYGLFEANQAIRKHNYVIMVEGYIDVLTLVNKGIDNVVAIMGTAISALHIKKLFSLCDDIYYCFDGDSAGYNASWNALEKSLPIITDTKVVHFVFLPDNMDPDDYIHSYSASKLLHLILNKSINVSKYLFDKLLLSIDINSSEGKAKLISLIKPYLIQITAPTYLTILKQQLASLVQLDYITVDDILNDRFTTNNHSNNIASSKPNNLYKQYRPHRHSLVEKINPLLLNKIKIVIFAVIYNIDWIKQYKLPDNIDHYSLVIQDMIALLDFINHNYDKQHTISMNHIMQIINIHYSSLNYIVNNHNSYKFITCSTKEHLYILLDEILTNNIDKKIILAKKIFMKNV